MHEIISLNCHFDMCSTAKKRCFNYTHFCAVKCFWRTENNGKTARK